MPRRRSNSNSTTRSPPSVIVGRDMLAQMANRTRTYIVKAQRRLTNLRSVNEAAEGYVKEKYGMDIEDFRKN